MLTKYIILKGIYTILLTNRDASWGGWLSIYMSTLQPLLESLPLPIIRRISFHHFLFFAFELDVRVYKVLYACSYVDSEICGSGGVLRV